jgi:hypothetical protein
MENKYKKAKEYIMWFCIIAHLLFISTGIVAKILHFDYWEAFLDFGIISLAISWLLVFLEIFMNDNNNRTYWILSLFFLPTISPAVYMVRREKLLNQHNEMD